MTVREALSAAYRENRGAAVVIYDDCEGTIADWLASDAAGIDAECVVERDGDGRGIALTVPTWPKGQEHLFVRWSY